MSVLKANAVLWGWHLSVGGIKTDGLTWVDGGLATFCWGSTVVVLLPGQDRVECWLLILGSWSWGVLGWGHWELRLFGLIGVGSEVGWLDAGVVGIQVVVGCRVDEVAGLSCSSVMYLKSSWIVHQGCGAWTGTFLLRNLRLQRVTLLDPSKCTTYWSRRQTSMMTPVLSHFLGSHQGLCTHTSRPLHTSPHLEWHSSSQRGNL